MIHIKKKDKEKVEYLKENGTFNQNHSAVKDKLFTQKEFFDCRDIIQVKYEMLRKGRKKNCPVKKTAKLFGMSRQNYYKVKNVFDQEGMAGLLPKRRGPKHAFKLTDDIAKFIETLVKEAPGVTDSQIAQKIKAQFKLIIHPRTIERFLKDQKKIRREK